MKQDNGQKFINILSQFKSKARYCQLQIWCECTKLVYYTEDLVLLMQCSKKIEVVWSRKAEWLKESAKNRQAVIIGDSAGKMKS